MRATARTLSAALVLALSPSAFACDQAPEGAEIIDAIPAPLEAVARLECNQHFGHRLIPVFGTQWLSIARGEVSELRQSIGATEVDLSRGLPFSWFSDMTLSEMDPRDALYALEDDVLLKRAGGYEAVLGEVSIEVGYDVEMTNIEGASVHHLFIHLDDERWVVLRCGDDCRETLAIFRTEAIEG